jgi:hypothetical protein
MVDIRKVVTPDEVAAVVGPVFPGYTEPAWDGPPAAYSPGLLYRWFIFQLQGGGTLSVSLRETPLDPACYPDFLPPVTGAASSRVWIEGYFVSLPVPVEQTDREPGRVVRVAGVGDDAYLDRDRGLLVVRVDHVEIAFYPSVTQPPSVKDLVGLARAGVARLRQQAR